MNAFDRLRQSQRWPSRWPIRWKLAAVSAGLTFVILVAFGFTLMGESLREALDPKTRR